MSDPAPIVAALMTGKASRAANTIGMSRRLDSLPPSIRPLMAAFRDELMQELGDNLIAVYLLGSLAFPGFKPHAVDLDFHVVVRRPISAQQRQALARLHRDLATRFRYGDRLDGFYLPLQKARASRVPTWLLGVARGKLRLAAKDEAWALHREHLHHRGYVALLGPNPRGIYPPASRKELEAGLEQELDFIVRHRRASPSYAVLNLCRLLYSWKTGTVTVSKQQSAMWALRTLTRGWYALIRAAVRSYQGKESVRDRQLLQERVGGFLSFAKRQIALFRARKTRGDAWRHPIKIERLANDQHWICCSHRHGWRTTSRAAGSLEADGRPSPRSR